jgi:hypothetical protein
MLSKYDNLGTLEAYWNIIKDSFHSIFSFELFKSFTGVDWGLICGFGIFSFVLYYISDVLISRVLRIKMFSNILEENN